MNQAFRHKFDVGKEDATKPAHAPRETAESANDYTEAGQTRNICFGWLDGKRVFVNYSYLISGEFSPVENIITLHFTSHVFIVKGLNLENLFYNIMHQITRLVVCVDQRYNDLQEDNQSVVNEIFLKPPEQP